MINVSLECRKLMQSNTAFQEHVTITLADSTVLTIPQSDLIIRNNGITSGAGANAFPIGQASARTIRLEIANFDDKYSKYDFYGARIGLVVKYPLSNGTENFNYGYYTVITPETRGTTIKITAVDDMYKADKPYTTNINFPTTLLAIYNDACQTLGLTVQTASFTNSNFVVDKKPENVSFRQVLGGIAMFAGGNIYINREGRVEIKTYDSTQIDAWLHYDGGVFKPWETAGVLNGGSFNPWNTGDVADGDTFANMLNGIHVLYAWISPPNVDTDDIVITGIRAETGADTSVLEGQEGYVLNVENPLIEGKEAAALHLIGNIVIGLKFRQFSGDYIGDPTIEFMDPCIVVDRKGNTYGSFVTDTDYSFRGKTGISNSAEPKIRTGISYSSNDTKTMQKTRALMDTRLTAYDAGIQMLTQLMNQCVGMYMTREIDANGSVTFYTHDQPTLAQSTIIRKVTANAITQSTDGGQTWTSGIDASGNAVLNTLAAVGINADWINAGQLVIRDGGGNETFFADTTTGIVRINAASFSLMGKDISEISNSGNLLIDPIGLSEDYWTLHGTITKNQTDPYGSSKAVRLVPLSGGEGYIQAKPSNNNPFKSLGVRYRISVWLRASNSSGLTNPIYVYFNGNAHEVKPTTSWKEYVFEEDVSSVTTTMPNDLVTIGGMGSFTPSDGYNLYVYRPRVTYALSPEEVVKDLSDNGRIQGIWMENGNLYISMTHLQGGSARLGGTNNGNGWIDVYDSNGRQISRISNEGIKYSSYSAWGTDYTLLKDNMVQGYLNGRLRSVLVLCAKYAQGKTYTVLNDKADGIRINQDTVSYHWEGDVMVEDFTLHDIALFTYTGITFYVPYGNGSDRRLKKNIKPEETDIIDSLRPVSFDWKESGVHVSSGFIAQEVQEILPELVFEDTSTGMLGLNYVGIVPHLVHKVQQQQKQINDLEARLSRLEEMLNGNS